MIDTSRAEFDPDAFAQSKITEGWVNHLFSMYYNHNYNLKIQWVNEKYKNDAKKDSKKPWDFVFFRKSDNYCRFLVEVEGKHKRYEKDFKKEGVDFIYRKVARKYPRKCYYFMPIWDDNGFYYIIYQNIEILKKYIDPDFQKPTNRGKLESFVRVPFEDVNVVKPSLCI